MDVRLSGTCDGGRDLVSPVEALSTVLADIGPVQGVEHLNLLASKGRVLAQDVTAPMPLPPFDHSAVDGYALAFGAAGAEGRFRIVGRIAAGRPTTAELAPGEAARIFTGAAVPAGCDAVVMQEHVDVAGEHVIPRRSLAAGANIRLTGEDVQLGASMLSAGTLLDARHIALLAASGIASVAVRRKVRVAVMSTGTELRAPGDTLADGAIHDSNRLMLLSLLDHPAIETIDVGIVEDDPSTIVAALGDAAGLVDLVITSGGVSVGEEDLVRSSVEAIGGRLRSLKIGMKPGKPLAFGRIGDAAILGLPGNPLAALVGFLVIGKGLVTTFAGLEASGLKPEPAEAAFTRRVSSGRVEFAPARIVGRNAAGLPIVDTLGRGGSARLMPLCAADGFCIVPGDVENIAPGDDVGYVPMSALDLFR